MVDSYLCVAEEGDNSDKVTRHSEQGEKDAGANGKVQQLVRVVGKELGRFAAAAAAAAIRCRRVTGRRAVDERVTDAPGICHSYPRARVPQQRRLHRFFFFLLFGRRRRRRRRRNQLISYLTQNVRRLLPYDVHMT